MSSNENSPRLAASATGDVAEALASAIDECAAAARAEGGAAEPDLSGRLAMMWGMLSDADPELAACMARYTGS